jgi:CheY-like chemotaxis protein
MDQLVMDRIFDPYFTTKSSGEGTGLGLAVVHGIVEDYGGTVTVRSKAGEGTTFQVFIPRIESFNHTQALEPIVSNLPKGKERILFVDDEEALARIGKNMLKQLGYEVVTRTSSFEALEAFRAQPHRFDLVVTDMAMPKMSGWDLAKNVMEIRKDIPIVLCTGFSEMVTREKARSIGIQELVTKPLDLQGLAETVRKVLDR